MVVKSIWSVDLTAPFAARWGDVLPGGSRVAGAPGWAELPTDAPGGTCARRPSRTTASCSSARGSFRHRAPERDDGRLEPDQVLTQDLEPVVVVGELLEVCPGDLARDTGIVVGDVGLGVA